MIALLRSSERRHVSTDTYDVWQAFFVKDPPGFLDGGVGHLLGFDAWRLQPDASTEPHGKDESEVITYVRRGALSQEDSTGSSGVLHTGEFQRMSMGKRIVHKETNVSQTDPVHFFRITLRPAQRGLVRSHENKRFTKAQRHNLLCVVASPDGRRGSLGVHQDVVVSSTLLDPGHHLVYEIDAGRTLWLHALSGALTLGDIVLSSGDSVAITDVSSVSLTVQVSCELLWIDLGPPHLPPWEHPAPRR